MAHETVRPASGPLVGECRVGGDKSIAHRALLLGAVAEGTTRIHNFAGGADNRSTIGVLRALGVTIREADGLVEVAGAGWSGLRAPAAALDCGNSGTTMRLGAGLLAGRPFTARLTGDRSLCARPMGRVIEPLRAMGADVGSEAGDGRPPLVVRGGRLHGITYRLPVASAQVKSAILLAGLQAAGETRVIEALPTRDHTERLLPAFGAAVRVEAGALAADGERHAIVAGEARLRGVVLALPGDFSAAAFLLVAALLVPGSDLNVRDVGVNPTRTGLLDVLRAMGAGLEVGDERVEGGEPVGTVRARASALRGLDVPPGQVAALIDEIPILCVAAARAAGTTRITGAAELRLKESDRIAVMAAALRACGVAVEELPDGLVVYGTGGAPLRGGAVASHGDHRIVMAMAVAALVAGAPIVIDDAAAAAVSDPAFFPRLRALAGR
jgi:3-phosphoshikimate 1-carboxyvinyltransferase